MPVQALVYAFAALAYLSPKEDHAEFRTKLEKNLLEKLEAAVKAKGFDGEFQNLGKSQDITFPKDDLSKWIGDASHVQKKADLKFAEAELKKEKKKGSKKENLLADSGKKRPLFLDKLRLVLQDVVNARGDLFGNSNKLFADNMGNEFDWLGQTAFPEAPAGQAAESAAEGTNIAPSWHDIKTGMANYEAKIDDLNLDSALAPGWISDSVDFGLGAGLGPDEEDRGPLLGSKQDEP